MNCMNQTRNMSKKAMMAVNEMTQYQEGELALLRREVSEKKAIISATADVIDSYEKRLIKQGKLIMVLLGVILTMISRWIIV